MKKLKTLVSSLLLILFLSSLSITNNSIQADTTAERIGAKCCDGTNSKATGRGACSKHGGVKYWKMSDGTKIYTGRCDD